MFQRDSIRIADLKNAAIFLDISSQAAMAREGRKKLKILRAQPSTSDFPPLTWSASSALRRRNRPPAEQTLRPNDPIPRSPNPETVGGLRTEFGPVIKTLKRRLTSRLLINHSLPPSLLSPPEKTGGED
jgi:hypothetical protein